MHTTPGCCHGFLVEAEISLIWLIHTSAYHLYLALILKVFLIRLGTKLRLIHGLHMNMFTSTYTYIYRGAPCQFPHLPKNTHTQHKYIILNNLRITWLTSSGCENEVRSCRDHLKKLLSLLSGSLPIYV